MGRGRSQQNRSLLGPRHSALVSAAEYEGQQQAPFPGPQQQAPSSPWSGFDPGLSRDQFNQQMMNRPAMTRMYDAYSGNDVYSQQRDLTDAFKAGEITSNQWIQRAQALKDTYGVETAAPNQFQYREPSQGSMPGWAVPAQQQLQSEVSQQGSPTPGYYGDAPLSYGDRSGVQQGMDNQYQLFNPQGNYRDQMRGQHGGKRGGKGGG
jgi:hypothetical protein